MPLSLSKEKTIIVFTVDDAHGEIAASSGERRQLRPGQGARTFGKTLSFSNLISTWKSFVKGTICEKKTLWFTVVVLYS